MFPTLAIFFFFINVSKLQDTNSTVDYYVELIRELNENGYTYEWPTSAEEFQSSGDPINYGSFDFVVIGSGSSGSVVASRLSEIEDWTVLLLEAGTQGDNATDVPNLYTPIQFTDYNWAYNSTQQDTCCLGFKNQVCVYPRGKGFGGTSLINGLVYARGYKWDFDTWEKLANSTRWSYDSVLEFFKKSENFVHNDPSAPYDSAYHGVGGPFRVEYHEPKSPQLLAFLEANKELGYNVADYNANQLGASQSQINTIHGKRLDLAKAYLDPIESRSNLQLLGESYVTKILFDKSGKTAQSVEFSHKGKTYHVGAKKEVILSAGAIGTPQILMLSGVGPKADLEELGIEVVADLKVGNHLKDNTCFFGFLVETNYTEEPKPLREYVKEYLNGVGPYAIPNSNQGVGFYESSYTKGTGSPDIELEFIPANATTGLTQRSFSLSDETYNELFKELNRTNSFMIYIISTHDRSSGSVKLSSSNPYDYPIINANFLSDSQNEDINIIYEGIQIALSLIDTQAFKAINATLKAGPITACKTYEFLSKDYWFCYIRQLTANLYHPLGTCKMGTDPKDGAVVDSELKVFGFENLRIADASVFPLGLSGHPNAPSVMVGEQLADIVKKAYNVVE